MVLGYDLMYKRASPAHRALGLGVAAVIFGSIYYYTDKHYPPHPGSEADFATPKFIWAPKNYEDPVEINKQPVVVPGKEVVVHEKH